MSATALSTSPGWSGVGLCELCSLYCFSTFLLCSAYMSLSRSLNEFRLVGCGASGVVSYSLFVVVGPKLMPLSTSLSSLDFLLIFDAKVFRFCVALSKLFSNLTSSNLGPLLSCKGEWTAFFIIIPVGLYGSLFASSSVGSGVVCLGVALTRTLSARVLCPILYVDGLTVLYYIIGCVLDNKLADISLKSAQLSDCCTPERSAIHILFWPIREESNVD